MSFHVRGTKWHSQVLVFGGDSLARITSNFYPAAMWRITPVDAAIAGVADAAAKKKTKKKNKVAAARMDAAFELCARSDATLDSRTLRSAKVMAMPATAQPITVAHLAQSPAPWKTAAYYSA
jgi:hypothetical protein